MRAFFAENLFVSIFVISFLLVTGIRFLNWSKKNAALRSEFLSLSNIGISLVASLFVGIFLIIIFLVFVFADAEKKFANSYKDLKNDSVASKPQILIADTAIYENIGSPNYIGKKAVSEGFKNKDTIVPVALFRKGGGISGDNYILANCKGKQLWVRQDNALTYCQYAYHIQPSEFIAKNETENILFWERANEYRKMYEKAYHESNVEKRVLNDTLIVAEYYKNDGADFLRIGRKKTQESYTYFVERRFGRGTVEGYTKKCAYYIQNGKDCKE
jgi:hypothetical protein